MIELAPGPPIKLLMLYSITSPLGLMGCICILYFYYFGLNPVGGRASFGGVICRLRLFFEKSEDGLVLFSV